MPDENILPSFNRAIYDTLTTQGSIKAGLTLLEERCKRSPDWLASTQFESQDMPWSDQLKEAFPGSHSLTRAVVIGLCDNPLYCDGLTAKTLLAVDPSAFSFQDKDGTEIAFRMIQQNQNKRPPPLKPHECGQAFMRRDSRFQLSNSGEKKHPLQMVTHGKAWTSFSKMSLKEKKRLVEDIPDGSGLFVENKVGKPVWEGFFGSRNITHSDSWVRFIHEHSTWKEKIKDHPIMEAFLCELGVNLGLEFDKDTREKVIKTLDETNSLENFKKIVFFHFSDEKRSAIDRTFESIRIMTSLEKSLDKSKKKSASKNNRI